MRNSNQQQSLRAASAQTAKIKGSVASKVPQKKRRSNITKQVLFPGDECKGRAQSNKEQKHTTGGRLTTNTKKEGVCVSEVPASVRFPIQACDLLTTECCVVFAALLPASRVVPLFTMDLGPPACARGPMSTPSLRKARLPHEEGPNSGRADTHSHALYTPAWLQAAAKPPSTTRNRTYHL